MKKKLVIALAAFLLIAIVFLLLTTVPFYPAFQKTVASMEKLRSAIRAESILYPVMADGEYSDCSYRLELVDEPSSPNQSDIWSMAQKSVRILQSTIVSAAAQNRKVNLKVLSKFRRLSLQLGFRFL